MTLGRQMYPENSNYLMKHFRLYGYVLIDLKPSPPTINDCAVILLTIYRV